MQLRPLIRTGLWLPLLGAPALAQVRPDFGVMIPMRDGVKLAADIWRPEAPGRYPVLLARTPYLRTGLHLSEWAQYFVNKGYGFVVQDTRGRGDSEGQFEFFFGDGKDGYDTIEWLAAQPWSNGRVGTLGLSIWAPSSGWPPGSIRRTWCVWRPPRPVAAGSRRFPTWVARSPTSGR